MHKCLDIQMCSWAYCLWMELLGFLSLNVNVGYKQIEQTWQLFKSIRNWWLQKHTSWKLCVYWGYRVILRITVLLMLRISYSYFPHILQGENIPGPMFAWLVVLIQAPQFGPNPVMNLQMVVAIKNAACVNDCHIIQVFLKIKSSIFIQWMKWTIG